MIERKVQNSKIVGEIQESQSYEIDNKNLAKIMKMLSFNYKDPHLAVIRELWSNVIDVHTLCNQVKPGIIKLPTITDNVLTIQDFGCGLNKEDFKRLILGFGASESENSNAFIGGKGLGAKSFYSITHEATCKSVFINDEGQKQQTTYELFKNEEDSPSHVILDDRIISDPSVHTGLTYLIPSNIYDVDWNEKTYQALKYFDILPDGLPKECLNKFEPKDNQLIIDKPDYKAIKSNKYSYYGHASKITIVMGGVGYDITNDISINSGYTDNILNKFSEVILKCDIGEFDVHHSRDMLQFDSLGKMKLKLTERIENLKSNLKEDLIKEVVDQKNWFNTKIDVMKNNLISFYKDSYYIKELNKDNPEREKLDNEISKNSCYYKNLQFDVYSNQFSNSNFKIIVVDTDNLPKYYMRRMKAVNCHHKNSFSNDYPVIRYNKDTKKDFENLIKKYQIESDLLVKIDTIEPIELKVSSNSKSVKKLVKPKFVKNGSFVDQDAVIPKLTYFDYKNKKLPSHVCVITSHGEVSDIKHFEYECFKNFINALDLKIDVWQIPKSRESEISDQFMLSEWKTLKFKPSLTRTTEDLSDLKNIDKKMYQTLTYSKEEVKKFFGFNPVLKNEKMRRLSTVENPYYKIKEVSKKPKDFDKLVLKHPFLSTIHHNSYIIDEYVKTHSKKSKQNVNQNTEGKTV